MSMIPRGKKMAKPRSFTFKYHEKFTGRYASFYNLHSSSDIRLNGKVCGSIHYSEKRGVYYCQFLIKEDPQNKDNKNVKNMKLNINHQDEKELRKMIKDRTESILKFFVNNGHELAYYTND